MKTRCYKDRFEGLVIEPQQVPVQSAFSIGGFFGILALLLVSGGCGFFLEWKLDSHPSKDSAVTVAPLVFKDNERPPQELSINSERWFLVQYGFDGWGGIEGQTDCSQRLIYYKPDIPKQRLRENLWHEVTHAAFCRQQSTARANWETFTKDSPEHDAVYRLGFFLPGFVHDNPEFVKWEQQ